MSTFYWEYGVEAFAEVPSIQDLVVTPLLGWVYGEWAHQTEIKIRDQDNEVMGSRVLGGVSLFFLDPIDVFGRTVNWMFGRRLVKAGYGYFSYTSAPHETETDHTVYLNMRIPIGGPAGPDPEPERTAIRETPNDPLTSGIVGLAFGTGHTLLDDSWGVDDGAYYKMSLGLYFSPRFSSRLAYAWGELTETATGVPVDYENYSLDGQYYFNRHRSLRPYVTAGFGDQVWKEDNTTAVFQWNAGLGLHWKLYRKWALHADWINYYSPDRDTYDQNINAQLVYRFGRGEHDDW
jgi:hypothetical protein